MNIGKLVFLFLFIISNVSAETLLSYKLLAPSKNHLDQVSAHAEIVKREGNNFLIYVTKEKQTWFKNLAKVNEGLNYELISEDVNAELKNHSFVNGYKTLPEVSALLDQWVTEHPKNFSKIQYGLSVGKKPLMAYVFKLDPTVSESNVKKVLITAATHGDELITVEVLLKQIEYVKNNYNTKSRLSAALKDKWLYFIPVVSPDSFSQRSRYVEGRDPNRAYPWPLNNNDRARVGVIDSLIAFVDQQKFYGSLDLHAYGQMVMYPWGYTTNPPDAADVKQFDLMVAEMSRENNYTHGQIATTIYIAKGSSSDYYYWKNKTRAIAVEIGNEKIPRIEKLPSILKETDEMFARFYEAL